MTSDLDIWQVKFVDESSRSQEKDVAKAVGATSSEGFLVRCFSVTVPCGGRQLGIAVSFPSHYHIVSYRVVSCITVTLLTGVGRVQRFALWFVDVGIVAAAAARRQVASRLVESA